MNLKDKHRNLILGTSWTDPPPDADDDDGDFFEGEDDAEVYVQ